MVLVEENYAGGWYITYGVVLNTIDPLLFRTLLLCTLYCFGYQFVDKHLLIECKDL